MTTHRSPTFRSPDTRTPQPVGNQPRRKTNGECMESMQRSTPAQQEFNDFIGAVHRQGDDKLVNALLTIKLARAQQEATPPVQEASHGR